MKEKIKGLFAGLLIGSMITGSLAYASNGNMIEVFYNIKDIKINKVSKMPIGDQMPFTYKGTTFVPLRYISDNLGQNVKWEGSTQTIHIGETNQPNEIYLGKEIQSMSYKKSSSYSGSFVIYQDGNQVETGGNITTSKKDNVGNSYDNFLVIYAYDWTHVEFPLNGQYKRYKATLALTEYMKQGDGSGNLQIFLDEQLHQTYEFKAGDMPTDIDINVSNANKIGFRVNSNKPGFSSSNNASIGLYNSRVIK